MSVCARSNRSAADVYAMLDMLNGGLSGYNTHWSLKKSVLPHFTGCPTFILASISERDNKVPATNLLAVWFGANDSCLKPSPQHVLLDTFPDNRGWIDKLHSPYHPPVMRIILIHISATSEDIPTKGRFRVTRSTEVVGSRG